MGFDTIHETAIKDVLDVIKDGLNTVDKVSGHGAYHGSMAHAGSLTKATSGLTLVFPVLVDTSLPIDTMTMVSKAVERKVVSLLQIAFSAFNVTNSHDAYDYLKNFHTNLGSKISMDDFLDAMSALAEHVDMSTEDRVMYNAVLEDMKTNCGYYLEDDISESSVNDFKIMGGTNKYSRLTVVREADDIATIDRRKREYDNRIAALKKDMDDFAASHNVAPDSYDVVDSWGNKNYYEKFQQMRQAYQDMIDKRDDYLSGQEDIVYRRKRDDLSDDKWQEDKDLKDKEYKLAKKKFEYQKGQDDLSNQRATQRAMVQNNLDTAKYFQQQVIPSDVKKANELVPTMMTVNFCTIDNNGQNQLLIERHMIIGIKAKLIPVNTEEMCNVIMTKFQDGNILNKFLRCTTRELSFAKDFLFAVDQAKIKALSVSKKGSPTYKALRLLERRAVGGKIRKTLKTNNPYKALATIVLSMESVEYLKKYKNIDVTNVKVIRPIMEKLSTMMFIIADESAESVSIMMDTGDDFYETLSYSGLERESNDAMSKKAINLMTKMAR